MNELLQQAFTYHQQKNLVEAKRLYEYLLKIDPKNFDALLLLGLLNAEQKQVIEAISNLQKALRINPESEAAAFNLAVAHSVKGDFGWSEKAFLQTIKINPGNVKAYLELAKLQVQLNKPENGLQFLEKAMQVDPENPEIYNEYGVLTGVLRRDEEAIASLKKALAMRPNYADALANLGNIYLRAEDFDRALDCFSNALKAQPDNIASHLGIAHIKRWSNDYFEAMLAFDRALEINPDSVIALVQKGHLWTIANKPDEALHVFNKAFAIDPDFKYLYGGKTLAQLRQAIWSDLKQARQEIKEKIQEGKPVIESFISLALFDSLEVQAKVANLFFIDRFGKASPNVDLSLKRDKKIKVAYISADFKNHPISFLTAELFELHDRDRFEIIGVSASAANDDMQQRISKAFDRFIEIHGRSDPEAIALLRDLNIDIAIDLGGYTQDSRFGIFTQRVAPVQMSYLGFLGTTGSNCIDYIIADEEIIPSESQQFYTEKVAYLPSYQVNDRKRKASDRIFTRSEFGIPEDTFVYCCFNNNYKLMPEVFTSWMNILRQVENSALLLYAENDAVRENLKKEAVKQGIDSSRLFFGERLSQADYLARFRVADLFLDTAPYNAGTTASDALWMNVPVLTRQGETFACRVASSILKAIDLPELITHSVEQYESLACELGKNPEKMGSLRAKLIANKSSKPLFDTPRFTRNLERLFERVMEKHQNGEGPSHTWVVE